MKLLFDLVQIALGFKVFIVTWNMESKLLVQQSKQINKNKYSECKKKTKKRIKNTKM